MQVWVHIQKSRLKEENTIREKSRRVAMKRLTCTRASQTVRWTHEMLVEERWSMAAAVCIQTTPAMYETGGRRRGERWERQGELARSRPARGAGGSGRVESLVLSYLANAIVCLRRKERGLKNAHKAPTPERSHFRQHLPTVRTTSSTMYAHEMDLWPAGCRPSKQSWLWS